MHFKYLEQRYAYVYAILSTIVLSLFVFNLAFGAVTIPIKSILNILLNSNSTENIAWKSIVIDYRIPGAITALLCGASLAISGLLLQTLFKNPLAGPSILGVSDGANLGVAIIMLYFGGSISLFSEWTIGSYIAIILAAFCGAGAVLCIIIYFSSKVKSNVMLLIIGIMIGYLASSLISILNFYSSSDKVHSFVMWGMGNFTGVSM